MVSSVWAAGGGGSVGLGIVVGGVVCFVWCVECVGCRPVEDVVGNVGDALADLFPSPRSCNGHDHGAKRRDNFTTANKEVLSAIIVFGTSLVRAGNVCHIVLSGCYHFNAIILTLRSALS
jgi:hypothetical protein